MLFRIFSSNFFVIGVLILILILHVLALSFGWYEHLDGFDDVHHFLGGIWVAASFFYFFKARRELFDLNRNFWVTFFFAIGIVVLGGVFWEFFEFFVDRVFADKGLIPKAQLGLSDTIWDLFFDLFGGAIFALFYIKLFKKTHLR